MGFAKDINRIMAILPERRQNLLFSATFSLEIKKMAAGILFDPELVEATPENTTAEKVIHNVIRVDKGMKNDLIVKLIDEGDWQQVLIFTRTKHGANKLSEKLEKSGMSSAAIHGNKTQNARTKALDGFKKGQIRVLVATDIAARGLDIPLLPHVVNYELPNVPEDYVHRIGRTGRAGASGEAVSLVCAEEIDYLRGIEKLLDLQLPVEIVSGFEPLEVDRQPPPKMGGGQRPPRSNDNRGGGGKPRPSGGGGNRPPAAKGNRPFNKNRDTKR
jgi:ATP-dependent RNA helicase RhlE